MKEIFSCHSCREGRESFQADGFSVVACLLCVCNLCGVTVGVNPNTGLSRQNETQLQSKKRSVEEERERESQL